jgi:hypothetical protein
MKTKILWHPIQLIIGIALIVAIVGMALVAYDTRLVAQSIDTGTQEPLVITVGLNHTAGISVRDGHLVGSENTLAPLRRDLQKLGLLRVDEGVDLEEAYFISCTFPPGTTLEAVRRGLSNLTFVHSIEQHYNSVPF